jgi:hypothetical protein
MGSAALGFQTALTSYLSSRAGCTDWTWPTGLRNTICIYVHNLECYHIGVFKSAYVIYHIIFYELFLLNFIIKIYCVIQNRIIFLIFFFISTKYEKDNDGCFLKCLVEMYWNARFTCNFFQFKFFFNYFYIFCVDFGKKIQNEV